jgi:TonB family protein
MLTFGFGSSVILHLGLIAGITHWWQPQVNPDEPLEITLVAPVEIDEIAPSPSVKPIASPTPAPKPVKIEPIPISTPVKSSPKSIPIAIKPVPKSLSQPLTPKITAQLRSPVAIAPPPKSKPIATKSAPKPLPSTPVAKPISSPSFNLPIPVEKPRSIAAKPDSLLAKPPSTPSPKLSFNSPVPVETPQQIAAKPTPVVNSPVPPATPRSIEDPPVPTKPKPPTDLSPLTEPDKPTSPQVATPPTQPSTPTVPVVAPNPSPLLTQKSTERNQTNGQPAPTKTAIAGGNNNAVKSDRSGRDRSTGSILPNNREQLDRSNSGRSNSPAKGLLQGNNPIPSTGTDRNGSKFGSNIPTGNDANPGSTNSPSSAGGLQCIKNCQIAKLQDLQDSDGGKDRLRIRIVVDLNGMVTAAEIVKSSGDRQIDSVVLTGIEQMQFKPSGKVIKGTVKANILF